MTNVPETNPSDVVQALTNEQNRYLEDITCAILANVGHQVVDRQISLPDDYPVSGHPDGRLVNSLSIQDFEDNPSLTASDRNPDGFVWGFEHKVLGYYSFMQVYKNGLYTEKPGYVTQAALYGDALGWDKTQFVILAADHTKLRSDMNRSRTPARDDWHPKIQLPVIDNRQLAPLVPQMLARATDLSAAVESGTMVEREYSGSMRFPCDYCEWKDRCNQDGDGGVVVTRNPI